MIKKGIIIHYLAHQISTKKKQPIQNDPQASEIGNPTQPNTAQQNTQEQTLIKE